MYVLVRPRPEGRGRSSTCPYMTEDSSPRSCTGCTLPGYTPVPHAQLAHPAGYVLHVPLHVQQHGHPAMVASLEATASGLRPKVYY